MSAQDAIDAADNQLAAELAEDEGLHAPARRRYPAPSADWCDKLRPSVLRSPEPAGWHYDPASSAIGVDE